MTRATGLQALEYATFALLAGVACALLCAISIRGPFSSFVPAAPMIIAAFAPLPIILATLYGGAETGAFSVLFSFATAYFGFPVFLELFSIPAPDSSAWMSARLMYGFNPFFALCYTASAALPAYLIALAAMASPMRPLSNVFNPTLERIVLSAVLLSIFSIIGIVALHIDFAGGYVSFLAHWRQELMDRVMEALGRRPIPGDAPLEALAARQSTFFLIFISFMTPLTLLGNLWIGCRLAKRFNHFPYPWPDFKHDMRIAPMTGLFFTLALAAAFLAPGELTGLIGCICATAIGASCALNGMSIFMMKVSTSDFQPLYISSLWIVLLLFPFSPIFSLVPIICLMTFGLADTFCHFRAPAR